MSPRKLRWLNQLVVNNLGGLMKSHDIRNTKFNLLYVGLVAVAFLIICGVALFAYWSYQSAVTELVVERDRELIQLSASRLKGELDKYADILESIAREPNIQQDNIVIRTRTLKDAGARLDVFDGGVILLDNLGKVIVAEPARPQVLGKDFSNRQYFSELLTGSSVFYSNAVQDGPGGSDVVVISTPVIGENGKFMGALAGMFLMDQSSISAFYASLVKLRLGQSGHTYVIDGEGRTLYRSGNTDENHTSRDLGWLNLNETIGALRTRDEENNDIVAAYSKIPSTPWILVSEDDWEILAGSSLNSGRLLLGILAAGMIIPALGVVMLMRLQNSEIIQKRQLNQDIEMSNRFQEMMLPGQIPVVPGWSIELKFYSSKEIRSEFHDLLLLPDGKLMVVAGRMEGNGMVCTFNIATLRAAFRSLAVLPLTPAEVMQRCNSLLMLEIQPGTRISCLYSILEPMNGRMIFVSAGTQQLAVSGIPTFTDTPQPGPHLGESWDSVFSQNEIVLNPEEFLVITSAGFLSARNKYMEVFGEKRMMEVLQTKLTNGKDYLSALEEVIQEIGIASRDDPLEYTLISLGRLPEEADLKPALQVDTRYMT